MAILIYDQHNGSRRRGIWTREFNGSEWNLMILFLELEHFYRKIEGKNM